MKPGDKRAQDGALVHDTLQGQGVQGQGFRKTLTG